MTYAMKGTWELLRLNNFHAQECGSQESISAWKGKSLVAYLVKRATHGIPEVLKRDNGPPFQGQAFNEFTMKKGFLHRKITTLRAEANGHAENVMKNLWQGRKNRTQPRERWEERVICVCSLL